MCSNSPIVYKFVKIQSVCAYKDAVWRVCVCELAVDGLSRAVEKLTCAFILFVLKYNNRFRHLIVVNDPTKSGYNIEPDTSYIFNVFTNVCVNKTVFNWLRYTVCCISTNSPVDGRIANISHLKKSPPELFYYRTELTWNTNFPLSTDIIIVYSVSVKILSNVFSYSLK